MADGLFGLLSGFGALAGIGEAREVRGREETLLEKLINLEQMLLFHTARFDFISKMLNRANDLLNIPHDDSDGDKDAFDEDALVSSLYSCLAKELELVEFTEKDICGYVYTRANREDEYSIFSGLLSGFLLSTLTERNLAKGKGTRFYIDGKGNRFDHLFVCARTVDELIVENFCGESICSNVGSNGGAANKVVGLNLKGRYALYDIGRKKGKIGIVLGKNIEGNDALGSIGREGGVVSSVLGFDIKGDSALAHIGINNGSIGLVYGKNIAGNKALASICKDSGKGGVVVGIDINGEDTLYFCGANNGNVNLVFGSNINGGGALNYIANNKGNVRLVVGENIVSRDKGLYANKILSQIAHDAGNVGIVIGKNLTSDGVLSYLGWCELGRIGKVIIISTKGEEALSYIGCGSDKIRIIEEYLHACLSIDRYKNAKSSKSKYELRLLIDQSMIDSYQSIVDKGPPNFIGEEYDAIGEVLCDTETDVTPIKICCKKLVIGNEANEEYERIMKEHKLNELIEILRSMYNQPYREVMEMVGSPTFKEMLK